MGTQGLVAVFERNRRREAWDVDCEAEDLFREPQAQGRGPEHVVDQAIGPLYASVLAAEAQHKNGQMALAAGFDFLVDFLKSRNTTYEALIFSL